MRGLLKYGGIGCRCSSATGGTAWPASVEDVVQARHVEGSAWVRAGRGRLKVLHVVARLDLGGAQLNTLDIVRGLDRGKFDPMLAAGAEGLLAGEAGRLEGVRSFFIRGLKRDIRPLCDAAILLRLVMLCRRERVAIVHTHGSKAGMLGRWAAWLARVPVIVHTVHGWSFHEGQCFFTRQFFTLLERVTARVSTRLVTVSRDSLLRGLERGIGRPAQYTVIRSAVHTGSVTSAAGTAARKKDELQLASGCPVVGTVSCLKEQKAPLDFVRVAAEVARVFPEARFLVVGDGHLRPRVEEAVSRAGLDGRFVLAGWRRDVHELIHVFDVFVLTSRWEGLPRAVVEAMAAAKPVVAAGVNGIPEVVRHGETGFVERPGDTCAMARRVCCLLADRDTAAAMGSAGRRSLDPDFDVRVMLGQLEALYEAAAAERMPPG